MSISSYLHFCRHVQNLPLVMWYTSSVLASLVIWLAHYLSVFLTVGSMVMVNLRVLGFYGKHQTLTQVADIYAPWMWTGLAILLVTGILMLTGDAALFCTNGVFGVNLLVVALAAIFGVIIKKRIPVWDRQQPSLTPISGKILAGVSLLLWLGTILTAVEVPQRSDVP